MSSLEALNNPAYPILKFYSLTFLEMTISLVLPCNTLHYPMIRQPFPLTMNAEMKGNRYSCAHITGEKGGRSASKMPASASIDAKVVFLGSASVGKTSIINRAISDEFDNNVTSTIGASYTSKEVEMAGTTVNLQMWDTAGQERFRTLAPMYYRHAAIALLIFSIVDPPSLIDVRTWSDEMNRQTDDMPTLFVVANKVDLEDERRVQTDEAANLAKELNAFYSEVSAKSGKGIDELFVRVTEEALNRLKLDQDAAGRASHPNQPHEVNLTKNPGDNDDECKC
jgi:small GTP-binding protein